MNQDAHILVTGGFGFMGSHFIDFMLSTNSSVRIYNVDPRSPESAPSHIQQWFEDERYHYVEGDITDSVLLEELVGTEAIDVIMNFAMITGRNRGLTDPVEGARVNVMGVASLLHIVEKFKTRLIQVGTDQVYGSIEPPGLANESTPMSPTSHFASEKAAADMLVYASYKAHGSNVVLTHPCNVIGPYQHPNELIPHIVTTALNAQPLTLWDDGLQQRQILFIQDYVNAMKIIMYQGKAGKTYNIASNHEVTILDLAHRIQNATQHTDLPIRYTAAPFVYDRRHALNSKMVRELGWSPVFTIDESIQRIVTWYSENRDWWEPIKIEGKVL